MGGGESINKTWALRIKLCMGNINIIATIRNSQQAGFKPNPVQTLWQLLLTLFTKCLVAKLTIYLKWLGGKIPESSQAPITLFMPWDSWVIVSSLYSQDLCSACEKVYHYHENTKTLASCCESWSSGVNNKELWESRCSLKAKGLSCALNEKFKTQHHRGEIFKTNWNCWLINHGPQFIFLYQVQQTTGEVFE